MTCGPNHSTAPSQIGFSDFFSRYREPGKQYENDGRGTCSLEGSLFYRGQTCKQAVDSLDQILAVNPQLQTGPEGHCIAFPIIYNGEQGEVCSNLNTGSYINHQKALRYVEEKFLVHEQPLPADYEQFNTLIHEIYQILTLGTVNYETSHTNKFRTEKMFLPSIVSQNELDSKAKASLNKTEYRIYEALKKLAEQNNLIRFVAPNFEQVEQVLNKVGFVRGVAPPHIEEEMKVFTSILLQQIEEKRDPIEIAAFIQTELMRICPFPTENEVLAGILMRLVLVQQNSNNRVVFQSRKTFLNETYKAIQALDPKLFATYLKDKAIPWTQQRCRDVCL